MQLSQILSSAIAQIKVSKSPITKLQNYKSHKKICPSALLLFQFLYNLKINFFVGCFNGGGLFGSVFFFFFFFFCLWLLLLLKKDLEGLIDVFAL